MKKGFSFVVLTSTVIIMVILLTSITIAGSKTVEDSKKLSFATEISTLQQSVESYKEKNNGSYPVKNSIVLNLGDLNENSVNQFIANGEIINNDKVVLNEIDYEKISITSLKYGNLTEGDTDMYAVSPSTGKVYYAKGMKIGSNIYFTLTDELSNSLSTNNVKSKKARENNNNLVIFSPSEINWTKNNVSVEIKVPISCDMKSIFVDGELTTDYEVNQTSQYNIYTISREGNYTIKVKYNLKNDTTNVIEATYNVDNVDAIVPVLLMDENLVSLFSTENDTDILGYLEVLDNKDTLSGIKVFKYESNSIFSGTITDEQKQIVQAYFENNGEEVVGDVIPVKKGDRSITVYIEDMAGNWILQTINIAQD